MRVAITVNTSWNIYNFRKGLINALKNEGHEVLAIAPKDEYSEELVKLGCEYVPVNMENTGGNPFKDLQLYYQLKSIYKQHKPHIALQFTIKPNIYGTLAAHSNAIPVVNNVSGLGTVFLNSGFSSLVAKKLYKYAFRHAEIVLFQNPDDREDFVKHVPLKNEQIDLVPGSGIDLDVFSAQPAKKGSKLVFLMVARLIEDKGVIEYLEASKSISKNYPQAEFHLLGSLDEHHTRGIKKYLIDEWSQFPNMKYLGVRRDVRDSLTQSDCVVLPSYREGTPKTLLEAAAMARPIVTTDVPGCREVVDHGENGLLCKARSSMDLAKKIQEMLELSPEQRSNMAKKSRILVERKFDEKNVIGRYLYHVRDILNKKTIK